MNISKKDKINTILAIISFILLVIIFKWTNYLSIDDYLFYTPSIDKEGFGKNYISDGYSGNTSTVNLPLNTKYTCKNMCAPTGRCSITGQQCLADIDCPGCQPYSPPLKKNSNANTPGYNDSGKLTNGVTPTYSTLTSDIGTNATIIKNNKFGQTPQLYANGVNTLRKIYNINTLLYDAKFSPPQLQYMPTYSKRYSVTGEFMDNGPLPSNAYLGKS